MIFIFPSSIITVYKKFWFKLINKNKVIILFMKFHLFRGVSSNFQYKMLNCLMQYCLNDIDFFFAQLDYECATDQSEVFQVSSRTVVLNSAEVTQVRNVRCRFPWWDAPLELSTCLPLVPQ